MKAIFIPFDQAHFESIMSILNHNNLRGFTYWENVQGRGSVSGEPHYGSHAWPGMNSAILTMVEDHQATPLMDLLRKLDNQTPALGLRAFVMNVEKTI